MMGAAGITNVGPINTPTTNTGAIAGFDPIMKWSKKKTKSRKKQESAGKQWVRRRDDPNHIDGRSKAARKLLKRISKRKKKMSEAFIQESGERITGASASPNTTPDLYQMSVIPTIDSLIIPTTQPGRRRRTVSHPRRIFLSHRGCDISRCIHHKWRRIQDTDIPDNACRSSRLIKMRT